MQFSLDNVSANNGLDFIAKFLTSMDGDDDEQSHPLLLQTFEFLLETYSKLALVRARMVQVINKLMDNLGNSGRCIEENVCDKIEEGMLLRLKCDNTAEVREWCVHVLSRLQNPDDPDCRITQIYQYHLSADTNRRVRMAILSKIARNDRNFGAIIERLMDIDEKVRKHCAIQICGINIKHFSIQQRIWIAETLLIDRSTLVRNVSSGATVRS